MTAGMPLGSDLGLLTFVVFIDSLRPTCMRIGGSISTLCKISNGKKLRSIVPSRVYQFYS